MNILVSACLLGIPCRYDAKEKVCPSLIHLSKKHNLIPICPEQLGGLATPREPAERIGNQVITKDGRDVTAQFMQGAQQVLRIAKLTNCTLAILKSKSPSCGSKFIYDGTFTSTLVSGQGLTCELLQKYNIKVIDEETPF